MTIYTTILAGNKNRHAWAIGLVNQAMWLALIPATHSWGLLPMNAAVQLTF